MLWSNYVFLILKQRDVLWFLGAKKYFKISDLKKKLFFLDFFFVGFFENFRLKKKLIFWILWILLKVTKVTTQRYGGNY